MAFLKVTKGPCAGQLVMLHLERTILGRHPSSQVVLDDGAVSRHHVEIVIDGGRFFLEDLHSRNGTEVNGVKVTQKTELNDGDAIRVCDHLFQFLKEVDQQVAQPGSRDCDFTTEGVRRIRRALEFNHVSYTGSFVDALQSGLLDECSDVHDVLSEGFYRTIVLDASWGTDGSVTFNCDAFLMKAQECMFHAFEVYSGPGVFHPEQIAQILKDEQKSLLCLLNVQFLREEDFLRLRGLGFTQGQHRVLYCGVNAYVGSQALPVERIMSEFCDTDGRPTEPNVSSSGIFAVGEGSSVLSALEADSSGRGLRLNVRPEIKLRAILEISNALGRVLDLEVVLSVVLESLFKIFNQADAGFVLLKDVDSGKLRVRAAKCKALDDDEVPISMTVVRQAMEQTQAILSGDVMGDRRFRTSESLTDLRLRSLMCAPLVGTDGRSLGIIQLSTLEASQPFTSDDLDLLISVSAQATLAVENATLHDAIVRRRDMERDMEFASQVQQQLLPSEPPQVEGFQFSDHYKSAYYVGGDYFDYIRLPDGRIAVAIGDVAGKGVSAALLMARLLASSRYHLASSPSPGNAMSGLNAEFSSSGLGFRLITLVFAVIDPKNKTVCIANAGHLPPVHRQANGQVTLIGMRESGLPVGVLPEQQFNEMTLCLNPGESLVFYTDGITEAMNEKDSMYGNGRLLASVQSAPEDVDAMVTALVESVEAFCGTSALRDDICVIAIRSTT